MKKLISVMVLLATVLGLFAGCGKKELTPLERAAEYLSGMYQTAGKDEAIPLTADMDVLSSVVVDSVSYTVEWSIDMLEGDAEVVTIGESKKENHVKIDIPLHSPAELWFNLTATVYDAEGESESVIIQYMVPGVELAGEGMTMEELLEAAYNLDVGESMEGLGVLTGVVSMINTPYDEGYKNVTITIIVEGRTDLPLKCYRMKGDEAANVGVGDTVTVSGTLKNYNDTIEFDAGCMLDELIKAEAPGPGEQKDPAQIVAEAYALEENASMSHPSTLTGTITSIDTPYDDGYMNLTVTMVVAGCEDKPIKCYRLKGEGADRLVVGDVITVTGVLMNYNGDVEFSQGCTLDKIEGEHGQTPTAPSDPLKVVDAAYALDPEASLPYSATLVGLITAVNSPYDGNYQNITVTMTVAGRETKPIQCFRLKGTGVDQLAVGDTITVTGVLKNYSGTVQFDAGCTLDSLTKGPNMPVTKPATEVEIVDQAYKLQRGEALPYVAELTGKVIELTEGYNTQFQNVTVVIAVPGREINPIKCYRMKGFDADKVVVGDTIKVSGTIKNYEGSIQFDMGCTMFNRIPGVTTPERIETDPAKLVDMAYALSVNQEMTYNVSLSGKVSQIVEQYNSSAKYITVDIKIPGREGKPIECYHLGGSGLDQIAVNDTITVVGKLKNNAGKVQLINCIFTGRTGGSGSASKPETDPGKIVDIAYALQDNTAMDYDVSLTGKVLSIDTPYNSSYQNVSVNIEVSSRPGKPILCYRLKGTGVDKITAGDTISVVGRLIKYGSNVQFDQGCTMTARTAGPEASAKPETDFGKIIDAAFALKEGESLSYSATLTGKVTAINTPYDKNYGHITVSIEVSARPGKIIQCYRLKGSEANLIAQDDTITVTGILTNYYGKIQFTKGCTLDKRVSGGNTVPTAPSDPKQIVDEAFALEKGESLPYTATLTGVIKSIDEPYSTQYKNVTFTITVEGSDGPKDLLCYRAKGDKAETVKEGDTVTVTGTIVNYVGNDEDAGTIEFSTPTIEN